jgi:hypothetical protein
MGALSGIGMLRTKTKRAFRWGKPMGKKILVKRECTYSCRILEKEGAITPRAIMKKECRFDNWYFLSWV